MKMTLKQALKSSSKSMQLARNALTGLPVGAWGETEQAMAFLLACLPIRSERDFTRSEFVAAAYTVDHAGRYRPSH